MAGSGSPLTNSCAMTGIKPAMVELPYPPIRVTCRNQEYGELLKVDYCGAVSELSAVTQYINNENRISCEKCALAKTILGIAMAEMMHLQKLGELINLLGCRVDFSVLQPGGCRKFWTPEYLSIPENVRKMLCADLEAERAAVCQYRKHMEMIKDDCVNAVLRRIILDEEYHIMILQAMLEEV